MNTLFVAWQEAATREWIPVARLDFDGQHYYFQYTRGAERAESFEPFGRLSALDRVYVSPTLLPFFANRVIAKSRPEYGDYLNWLGLEKTSDDMQLLGMSGGIRGTDTIELIPAPKKTESGDYAIEFFARGLRHFDKSSIQAVSNLRAGDRLMLVKDSQNPIDSFALFLRTLNPISFVGYVPRFYSRDLNNLLNRHCAAVDVRVARVNDSAPLSMRLLCSVTSPWPSDFVPFEENQDFTPIVGPATSHL